MFCSSDWWQAVQCGERSWSLTSQPYHLIRSNLPRDYSPGRGRTAFVHQLDAVSYKRNPRIPPTARERCQKCMWTARPRTQIAGEWVTASTMPPNHASTVRNGGRPTLREDIFEFLQSHQPSEPLFLSNDQVGGSLVGELRAVVVVRCSGRANPF